MNTESQGSLPREHAGERRIAWATGWSAWRLWSRRVSSVRLIGQRLAAEGIEGNEEFHEKAVALDLPPGDCVLFHPRTLHRTGGNRTRGHRRVITLHMASAACKPTTDLELEEYGFTSVRGRTYQGCLQPKDDPSLRLATRPERSLERARVVDEP